MPCFTGSPVNGSTNSLRLILIIHNIFLQLILNVLFDCPFVLSNCVHIIPSAPIMSVPVFVLQLGMSVEYHQTAFTFQVSHVLCHSHVRWYCYEHMDVIWATFRFYDFYSPSFTQLSKNFSYICLEFPIYLLSSMTLGQAQYDTCISIGCVINFLRHSFDLNLLCLDGVVARPLLL